LKARGEGKGGKARVKKSREKGERGGRGDEKGRSLPR